MKVLFCIVTILVGLPALSQSSHDSNIKGSVLSRDNLQPVPNAHISLTYNDFTFHRISDEMGQFVFPLPPADFFQIQVSHIAYKDTTFQVSKKDVHRHMPLEFLLSPIAFDLPTAEITSAPKEVFASQTHHVADFAFQKKGILLLTYQKEDRWKRPENVDHSVYQGCKLVYIDSTENEICSLNIAENCFAFYEDYLNECFLETETGMYHIDYTNPHISLKKVDKQTMENVVIPIIDTINNYTVGSNYFEDYPAFEYFGFNHQDSSFLHFCQVIDEPLMTQYRSEYKWLSPREKLEAYRISLKHNVDKEVVGAMLTGFSQSMYFEELYAPLFVEDDTLEIFDHYKHLIFKFDEDLKCIDSIPISYHLQKHWAKELLHDAANGDVFAVFEKSGKSELRCVDKLTGQVTKSFQLTYKYPEKIRVYDGVVYYIYRPFESSQKRFLYKEILN